MKSYVAKYATDLAKAIDWQRALTIAREYTERMLPAVQQMARGLTQATRTAFAAVNPFADAQVVASGAKFTGRRPDIAPVQVARAEVGTSRPADPRAAKLGTRLDTPSA